MTLHRAHRRGGLYPALLRIFLFLVFLGLGLGLLTIKPVAAPRTPLLAPGAYLWSVGDSIPTFTFDTTRSRIRFDGVLTRVDTSDTGLVRYLDRLRKRGDSVWIKGDSLRVLHDSLGARNDTLAIDSTWVVYLDSTARLEQFVHQRVDPPAVEAFPKTNYSLYLDIRSPAYRRELTLDSTGQYVTVREKVNDADVKPRLTLSLEEYIHQRYEYEKHNNWRSLTTDYKFKDTRDQLGGVLSNLTNIDIPVPANPIFSIFGPSRVNLKISGAVDIRFGFRRQTSDQVTLSSQDQTRNEPNFNQEVRINVNGTIGDKLNIGADWNTERTFEYENQLKIKYTGYDDEIVQSVEAGNVSLQTPGLVGGGVALFGIKAKMQMGPLTLTTLLSQKKGQTKELSLSGGAQSQSRDIYFHAYSQSHYFVDTLYRAYWEDLTRPIPQIRSPQDQILQIDVWRTIINPNETPNAVRATAFVDLKSHVQGSNYDPGIVSNLDSLAGSKEEGFWIRLDRDKDFRYDDRKGYITLLSQPNDDATAIAVTYRTVGFAGVNQVFGDSIPGGPFLLKLIKPKGLWKRPDYKAWKLMLRNIYPLGASDIKPEGFSFKVFRTTPGQSEQDAILNTNLLQVLGLDRFDGNGQENPDNQFDFSPKTIDVSRGEIIFPTLEPLNSGIVNFFGNKVPPIGVGDSLLFADVYDTTQDAASKNTTKNRYIMRVSYTGSQRSRYALGFNVVEGSVQVLYNGSPLSPGIDYTVDYIVGEVVIRKQEALLPGANVQVKYEQNDLFQLASKTLIGARGELDVLPNTNLGFTVMNLSQATLSDKVRLGEEPTKNLIMGVDASSSFNLPILTSLINALPFIRTREMSTMRISGEAAYVIPDPNTKKSTVASDNNASIAYIDDFEGSRRDIPFPINYSSWTLASPPKEMKLGNVDDSLKTYARSQLRWYNVLPNDPTQIPVVVHDIWPDRQYRTGEDRVNVISFNFDPNRRGMYNFASNLDQSLHRSSISGYSNTGRFDDPVERSKNWGGVMRYVGPTASGILEQNISYLEIWMQATSADAEDLRKGRLYVNIGRISEDAIPNKQLNSEALIGSISGQPFSNMTPDRDFGLDMIKDEDEQRVHAAFLTSNAGDPDVDPADPSGDDYAYSNTSTDANKFAKLNGTEKNFGSADGYFANTEDLNTNGIVDVENQYLEYEIPLDSVFIDPDAALSSAPIPNPWIVGGGRTPKKWYQYRIPLLNPKRTVPAGQSPQALLQNVQIVRLWLSGFSKPVSVRIAEMGLVGNQWQERTQNDTIMRVSVVNLEDTPGYTLPPGINREIDRTTDQQVQKNEQSLGLVLNGLERGDSRSAFKAFNTRPLNLFDYKSMKLFIHGDPSMGYYAADRYDAEFFIRFGADSLNYYEYRQPLTPGWQEVSIPFNELTAIKAARDSANRLYELPATNGPAGSTYGVRGNPSLRGVAEIVVGVTNPLEEGSSRPLRGEVWVNELRLVDVDNSPGLAYRLDTQVKLADFGNVSFSYAQTDPNFHSLAERFGSRATSVNWALNASFSLYRFFSQEWAGTSIPFTYSHTENIVKPKYLPNSDIVVEEAAARAAEKTDSTGKSATTTEQVIRQSQTLHVQDSYSVPTFKIVLPSQQWYLRDTFSKLSFSFNYNTTRDRDPAIVTRTTWQWSARAQYGVTLPSDYYIQPLRAIFSGIFLLSEFKDWKLYYMPFMNFSASLGAQRARSFEQIRGGNNAPRETRSIAASRQIGFGWRLTEGGLLGLGGDYSLQTDRNILPFDNDTVGTDFGSLLKTILFRGEDRRYSQRVTVNGKPRVPNILDINKYINLTAGYGVNYSWQNGFQLGDVGKSAGWDNNITFGVDFRLKSLTDPWFDWKDEPAAAAVPPPVKPNPGKEEELASVAADSTKKSAPEPAAPKGQGKDLLKPLKTAARIFIKIPFLDYETINISFQQANRSTNSGVVGSTGFMNFWGRLPFQSSSLENGPSQLYQLGLSTNPGSRRAALTGTQQAVLSDQFAQTNNITLRTSRPLWEGASLEINWKVGWQFSKSTSVTTDTLGNPTYGAVSTNGSVERSFLSLPPVLFFKVFRSNLEEVGKKFDKLSETENPNDALAESFEQGLEALPFLNKFFGQFVPRPNWSLRWDGIEKIGGLSSVVEKLSLEHSYNSSFRRDFRGIPELGEQTDVERVSYGFAPLAGINATFRQFLKGNLSGNLRYNSTTSYDLNLASRNISEVLSQEMSLSLTYSRKGFSFPLFGLNLSNDVDMSLTYSRTKNSRRQHLPQFLSATQEGTPLDGNTRTLLEPRIRYVLSTRVSASIYYRYSKLSPDEGGSSVFGTTSNEAGVDLHISI